MQQKPTLFSILPNTLFLIATLALITFSLACYTGWRYMSTIASGITQTQQSVYTAESLHAYLAMIEIGHQSYLNSKDPTYLHLPAQHRDSVLSQLAQLKHLVSGHPDLHRQATLLQHRVVHELLQSPVLPVARLTESLQKARTILAALTQAERQVLQEQTRTKQTANARTEYILLSLLLVYTLAIPVLGILLRQQLSKTQRCERELDTLRQELDFTYEELIGSSEELTSSQEQVEWLTRQVYQEHLLEKDTELRAQTENQLRLKTDELQVLNQELNNFAHRISHDTRGTLVTVLGLTHLISDTEERDIVREYCKMMDKRLRKSDHYLQSMMGHLWSMQVREANARIDFDAMIQHCREELTSLPQSDRLIVFTQIEGEADFYSDPLRISIIIRNLLSYAIQYLDLQPPQSYLRFHIRIDDQQASLRVEDNGVGLEPEKVSRLSDKFFRVGDQPDSCGLGLFLVKQIVQILGGSISINSATGQGTRFEITLLNRPPAESGAASAFIQPISLQSRASEAS